jgi:hypothetical protein
MENKRKESTEVNVSFWVKRSCKTYLSLLFGSDVILEQIIMRPFLLVRKHNTLGF